MSATDRIDGIEEDFSREAARVEAREAILVLDIGGVGGRSELVGVRIAYFADQVFEIEVVIDKDLRKGVEQLGVGGGIGDPHIIFGFYESLAEEVFPVAVGE